MDRRAYVASVAGLFGVSLAGCTEESGPSNAPATTAPQATATATPTATATTTPTATETATAAPADIRVVSINAPSEAEIGENVSYTITVENAGESAGSSSFYVQTRTSDSDWSEGSEWPVESLGPGETRELQSQEFTLNRMTTVGIRVQDTSVTAQIQFVPARFSYSGVFTMPNGLQLSAIDVQVADRFTWEASGYTYEETPRDGMQWAMPTIWVNNETGQPADAPFEQDFVLLADNSQYESTWAGDPSWRYEYGTLQPGVVREGRILFEIPESLSVSELTTVYSRQSYEGNTTVYWSFE